MEEHQPDLILLDINLPHKNGIEVVSELRIQEDYTPIIVLSAREDEYDKVATLRLGADDYVTKPFALAELLARVDAVLRRANQHQRRRHGTAAAQRLASGVAAATASVIHDSAAAAATVPDDSATPTLPDDSAAAPVPQVVGAPSTQKLMARASFLVTVSDGHQPGDVRPCPSRRRRRSPPDLADGDGERGKGAHCCPEPEVEGERPLTDRALDSIDYRAYSHPGAAERGEQPCQGPPTELAHGAPYRRVAFVSRSPGNASVTNDPR